MRLAIFAATRAGASLALRVAAAFPADVYCKAGRCPESGAFQTYDKLGPLVAALFARCDALVFVMATGIAVRVIAPHIVHKGSDPAVVVLDERGQHAISLLSGHLGGANALTLRIAAAVGADPVVTTATDVNGRVAADVLAAELGLSIASFERLKYVNGEIAAGAEVGYWIDSALPDASRYRQALAMHGAEAEIVSLPCAFDRAGALVTDALPEAVADARVLVLRPRRLAAGIGCRRGASEVEILAALEAACARVGKRVSDIARIGSTVVKRDEAGLLAAAEAIGAPLTFYENDALEGAVEQYGIETSDFVKKQIGVGNVCEAAAMLMSQSKQRALGKTKFPKVTVALAWER